MARPLACALALLLLLPLLAPGAAAPGPAGRTYLASAPGHAWVVARLAPDLSDWSVDGLGTYQISFRVEVEGPAPHVLTAVAFEAVGAGLREPVFAPGIYEGPGGFSAHVSSPRAPVGVEFLVIGLAEDGAPLTVRVRQNPHLPDLSAPVALSPVASGNGAQLSLFARYGDAAGLRRDVARNVVVEESVHEVLGAVGLEHRLRVGAAHDLGATGLFYAYGSLGTDGVGAWRAEARLDADARASEGALTPLTGTGLGATGAARAGAYALALDADADASARSTLQAVAFPWDAAAHGYAFASFVDVEEPLVPAPP